jgi:uncharacterized protein (TIGR03437 family)
MNNMKLCAAAWICMAAAVWPAAGQTWDNSGNGLLQGMYYFREVIWLVNDQSGGLGEALSLYGNISFDGKGNYTLQNVMVMDTSVGVPQPCGTGCTNGTYSIAASGYGFISSPISSGDAVHGLTTQGVFMGSSTEAGFNDMFVAAPVASPALTNSSFRGTYNLVQMDSPDGTPSYTSNCQVQISPDGNGNIPATRVTGLIAGYGNNAITQNLGSFKYFFSNGAANVNFGGSLTGSNLIAGTKYLYFSPDGNFVFGGSPTGWDMILGVRSGATLTFSGVYYQAGMYQDESYLASAGFADLNTYFGSLKAASGTQLAHQRLLSGFASNAIDYTYSDTYTLKSDGTYDDTNFHYIFGANGDIRIGVGKGPFLGINAALRAPSFTPTGVFIDPTGVVNAGSYAMFTAGISPGELFTIFGSNLASGTLADPTFPKQLGGVQVSVNNTPAPLYLVSPGQISAVVPFGISGSLATIQVTNQGTPSNVVTSYVNQTSPGVFTVPPTGVGYAAALHPDYKVVTAASPAQVGETIAIYLTGLGAVTPAVPDATPGPINPYSLATQKFSIYIGGKLATAGYVGLAPGLVGLYQINVTVPAGVANGDAILTITGPDYETSQALIPIGAAGSATSSIQAAPEMTYGRPLPRRDPGRVFKGLKRSE